MKKKKVEEKEYIRKGKRYVRSYYEEYEIAYEAAQRSLRRRGYEMHESKMSPLELDNMTNAAISDGEFTEKTPISAKVKHLVSRQKGLLSHKEALGYVKLTGKNYYKLRYGKAPLSYEEMREFAGKEYHRLKDKREADGYKINAGLWASHEVSQNIFGSL